MFILLLFLRLFECKDFLSLETFTLDSLSNKESEFIYVYYLRPGMSCQACEYFNEEISTLSEHITVKKLNFFEDPFTASHFYPFLFPSFYIRENGRTRVINTDSIEALKEIITSGSWRSLKPIPYYKEANTKLTRAYALINHGFFILIQKSYFIVDLIPNWLMTFFFSVIIVYMARSIYIIFSLDIKKAKKK